MQFLKHPLVILLAFAFLIASAHAGIYHLDPIQGDDSNSGLTPNLAWRSLEKVNATVLKPGDQLLFKAGGRWSGQFTPKGGGDSKARVLIGRYGDGPLPQGVAVVSAPALVGPLSPAPGFPSLKAFRPAKNQDFPRGRIIPANGGRDILGNPVSSDQPPTIGAIESARVVSTPSL